MKIYFYSIQYKKYNNTFSKMDQYLNLELAEKECQKANEEKKDPENNYFVGLESEEIEKDYNFKGYYIIKTQKGFNNSYYMIFKNEDGKRTYISWMPTLKGAKREINKYILSSKLFDFCKGIRQYNIYSISRLIIEKSFNHGSGSLALFKILPEEKKIKVNTSLATKRDFLHLEGLQKALRTNYDLQLVSYGYPDYYTKSF